MSEQAVSEQLLSDAAKNSKLSYHEYRNSEYGDQQERLTRTVPPWKGQPVVKLSVPGATRVDLSFFPGIYIMPGGTAAGKTLTSVALSLLVSDLCKPKKLIYVCLNEPRGIIIKSLETALFAIIKSDADGFILDSFNFLMYLFAKDSKSQAFKGGIVPEYHLGLLQWNVDLADNNKFVIAVLNSDLFPIDDLEGAVEGRVTLKSPFEIGVRDRTNRIVQDISIPHEYRTKAMSLVYPSGKIKSASSGSIFSGF